MTEKAFERKIERWLHSIGVYKLGTHKQDKHIEQIGCFFKMWGGGMSASGIPDLICCINGKFVGIEVKAKNGRASKLQEINIDSINESSGIGAIVYPKDFEDLKTQIGGLI